ncbi:MAG: matrixin family metalloprotease [Bacteriovoracaceae bacterium]|nr:matrixin family metalloprotease [Bacteriovoracaceae bacterium]
MLRILFLILLCSCVPSQKESLTTGGATNPNAPSRWSYGSFPKTVSLSTSFSPAEVTELKNSAAAWTTHAGNGTTFFSIPNTQVADKGNTTNLDSLLDREFGVYKATQWNRELDPNALAVTQIFGVRHNTGSSSEYIEIVDADILVNWRGYRFAPTDPSGYDLFTVVLHEYGHFLGLGHVYNYSYDSVMYTTIGYSTFYIKPGSYDISTIQTRYNIGTRALGAKRSIASVEKASTHEDVMQSGRGVKITMELLKDGECVHKENGIRQGSHFVDLIKSK